MRYILIAILAAICTAGAKADSYIYTHPDGEHGWYMRGLTEENDGTLDMRHMYGLRFVIESATERQTTVKATMTKIATPGRRNLADSTSAVVTVSGPFPKEVTIPLKAFDYNRGQEYFLKYIKTISIDASGNATIKDFEILSGNTCRLDTPVKGKPLDNNGATTYTVTVTNTSSTSRDFGISVNRDGWETMSVVPSVTSLTLQPDESRDITINVKATRAIAPGQHEYHKIAVYPADGNGEAETMTLVTVQPITYPFLIHTPAEWDEIKANTQKYDWAAEGLEQLLKTAREYKVPEVRIRPSDNKSAGIVRAYIEGSLVSTAIAWYLTGEKEFGEKVAETLRLVSDPVNGYPATNHLTLQGIPQEGGTMEGMLHAYDFIRNDSLLTDTEKSNVENMFRLFCNNFSETMGDGGISNWTVFNHGPAAQCALLLGDIDMFNRFAYGPCGLIDHLRYGTLDDGWWYEMSLSYNLGCASCYTMVARSAALFGIDWVNAGFPSATSPNVGLRPFEYENFQGMAFGKFGPVNHPDVSIKRMWDGIVAYPDYRGVMFGMGDGHEQLVAGNQFEMAYYVFRDPAYASIIKRSPERNFIWAVAELPDDAPDMSAVSATSPNSGITVLRSQKYDPEQRIQVALKYGTHGSYHGHFDQLSLLSLMRYGRSFYNPETSWWGYGSYMYKWWVQPSMSHNMVVVDGLQKEPTECSQNLFYAGDMMQANEVSTISRWSNPPYMGGYDRVEDVKHHRNPYVPIPDDHPQPADIGEYTDAVFQRRLTVVTDDYVLLADYLEADSIHTYDNLLQLRGVTIDGDIAPTGHDAQFDTSPLSSGQFITSVDNYDYSPGTVVRSVHRYAPVGADGKNMAHGNWETGGQNRLYNTPGELRMDVYPLWPARGAMRVGDYAECWSNDHLIAYSIESDGIECTRDTVNSWLLGTSTFDVKLDKPKTLRVNTGGKRSGWGKNAAMLVDCYLTTADGQRIDLSTLPAKYTNVNVLPTPTADYYGGPVKIAGRQYDDAIGLEPVDFSQPAAVEFDLSGIQATGLSGTIGSDYFTGDEEQLRKTVAVRQRGTKAKFITLIEPFESKPMVKSAEADDEGKITVTLTDGRKQKLEIQDFFNRSETPKVTIKEFKGRKLLREETTSLAN
ncbi:MAG: hypothetical protein K2N28_09410 [Muribaculaceae bacterium]|nr:hypothetical protein [Muribaculaceae bacterium]